MLIYLISKNKHLFHEGYFYLFSIAINKACSNSHIPYRYVHPKAYGLHSVQQKIVWSMFNMMRLILFYLLLGCFVPKHDYCRESFCCTGKSLALPACKASPKSPLVAVSNTVGY